MPWFGPRRLVHNRSLDRLPFPPEIQFEKESYDECLIRGESLAEQAMAIRMICESPYWSAGPLNTYHEYQ